MGFQLWVSFGLGFWATGRGVSCFGSPKPLVSLQDLWNAYPQQETSFNKGVFGRLVVFGEGAGCWNHLLGARFGPVFSPPLTGAFSPRFQPNSIQGKKLLLHPLACSWGGGCVLLPEPCDGFCIFPTIFDVWVLVSFNLCGGHPCRACL